MKQEPKANSNRMTKLSQANTKISLDLLYKQRNFHFVRFSFWNTGVTMINEQ